MDTQEQPRNAQHTDADERIHTSSAPQGGPLVAHVCATARALVREGRPVHVVVGHQAEEVKAAVRAELGDAGAIFITQTEQRGTGDAVMAARDALKDAGSTLLVL